MMLSSPAVMAHPSGLWLALPGRMSTERTGEIAQRWMEMVLGEKFADGFPKILLSGEWLCTLANRLFQATGMRDHSCVSSKTSWPSAMSVDSVAAISTVAVAGSMEDPRADDRRSSERIRDSSDMWLQQKRLARDNVEEYLRACQAIGVPPQDIFEPDDLLELRNLDKVYRNLLSLQNVAVSISHRRSIDARSSASISMRVNVSDSTMPSTITPRDSFLSIRSSTDVTKDHSPPWDRLLAQYEIQQLKSAKLEESKADLSQTQGIGKLAHDTWRTEEHIRALLLRDDGSADPVPDDLHGKLWMLASGAATEMRRRKGEYAKYVAMELEDTDATRQIDADLHRTVPDEDKATWTDEKSKMMRRVLVAYSFFNPTLGYCQGLNYIVARLLQFVDEEEAFFLLAKMLRLVPDDYYTTMLGLAVDQHVFADLVRLQAPEVVKHLEELGGSGMELSLACTEWFLTLFSSPCPKAVTVRIWDLIFLIGDEILFRIALALMDLEKPTLLKCNTYGDMLHGLNEIGRHKIDAKLLVLDAQKKDVVSRLRIDDFRAHHRLQLATGIAVQSVEEATDPTSNEHTMDSKEEAKAKLFGSKQKKQGIFKAEKNAGRIHRTFDRHLTEEYTVSLQKEHPTFSCYYDGRPPIIFDQYWGSAASQTIWGRRNYRRITEAIPLKEQKEERRRLQSDGSGLSSAQKLPDEIGSGPSSRTGSGRERRSKSIGLIPPNPKSTPNQLIHPQVQQTRKAAEEDVQLSSSPKNWLQRIEGWHKELKIQKERKKMEKLKMKLGLADGEGGFSLPTRGMANRERSMNHTFAAPTWRHIEENELRGNSFDGPRVPKSQVDKRRDSLDVNVSTRSHSDPFLSPSDINGRSSFHDSVRQSLGEDNDARVKARSQEPNKSEFASTRNSLERRRSGSHLLDIQRRGSGSSRSARHPITETISRRRPSSAQLPVASATAALDAFEVEAIDPSRLSFDMGQSAAPPSRADSAPATTRESLTKGMRGASADLEEGKVRENLFQSFGSVPSMRRNHSMPFDDGGANIHLLHQQLHNQQQFYGRQTARKMTPETARVIRERAQVLSYMQRKASDASSLSLGGSFPLTPGERGDVLRISESSSDSSRYSEFMLPTTRSAKSVAPPAARKSSFSFFDKLSSEVDDLHGSFLDDNEPRESFDSGIFSRTWSPSSAHHKILAATTTTD